MSFYDEKILDHMEDEVSYFLLPTLRRHSFWHVPLCRYDITGAAR